MMLGIAAAGRPLIDTDRAQNWPIRGAAQAPGLVADEAPISD